MENRDFSGKKYFVSHLCRIGGLRFQLTHRSEFKVVENENLMMERVLRYHIKYCDTFYPLRFQIPNTAPTTCTFRHSFTVDTKPLMIGFFQYATVKSWRSKLGSVEILQLATQAT